MDYNNSNDYNNNNSLLLGKPIFISAINVLPPDHVTIQFNSFHIFITHFSKLPNQLTNYTKQPTSWHKVFLKQLIIILLMRKFKFLWSSEVHQCLHKSLRVNPT